MPKCINDPTKSYKGDEPSPKGKGYSAGKEEPGFKLLGLDGIMYIVQKTTTCNRWIKFNESSSKKVEKSTDKSTKESSNEPTKESSDESAKESSDEPVKITKLKKQKDKVLMCVESNGKQTWQDFDFAKLPEDCYTYAYLPICEKMTEPETGLEEKFGGSFPYLTKSKPHDDDFTFLCQFKDPRSEDDSMYQVFISEDLTDHDIRKIKLDKAAIKNQYKYDIESEFEPYKITGWNKVKELATFDKLRAKFKFSKEVESILWNQYFDHPLLPNQGIKVGGSPMATQAGNYDNMDLLQLARKQFLNFEWGDSGIAHVSTELELLWDCC